MTILPRLWTLRPYRSRRCRRRRHVPISRSISASTSATPIRAASVALGLLATVTTVGRLLAAEKPTAVTKAVGPDQTVVQMNFPQEIEVKALVDYVSERLKINILYDQEIANKKISVKAPDKIPVRSSVERAGQRLEDEGVGAGGRGGPGLETDCVGQDAAQRRPQRQRSGGD